MPNEIKVTDDTKEVTFAFRVRKPMKNVTIFIKDGQNVLKKQIKPTIIPSEMEKVVLKDVDFRNINEITVSVEEN